MVETFSPHAWGWSETRFGYSVCAGVFPTRVGMVRNSCLRNRFSERFPHTRGDGPNAYHPRSAHVKFSPHAWGWSAVRLSHREHFEVFPTRVGMVRQPFYCSAEVLGFPHTRGDGPSGRRRIQSQTSFSPHAWGWSVVPAPGSIVLSVFPTRVGMVRPPPRNVGAGESFPHTRGDGPGCRRNANPIHSFSPHAWGWSVSRTSNGVTLQVFPTRVGMVRSPAHSRACLPRFPHTRGDGPPT